VNTTTRTPVLDRNGRLVHVYKRDDTARPASERFIVMPSTSIDTIAFRDERGEFDPHLGVEQSQVMPTEITSFVLGEHMVVMRTMSDVGHFIAVENRLASVSEIYEKAAGEKFSLTRDQQNVLRDLLESHNLFSSSAFTRNLTTSVVSNDVESWGDVASEATKNETAFALIDAHNADSDNPVVRSIIESVRTAKLAYR
jgi:hypothetical protein